MLLANRLQFTADLIADSLDAIADVEINHAAQVAREIKGPFVQKKNASRVPAQSTKEESQLEYHVLSRASLLGFSVTRVREAVIWRQ